MIIGKGLTERFLTGDETREVVGGALSTLDLQNKRVLFIIPDGTRTMPMPLMFDLFEEVLGKQVAALDYLVALGTHQPMSDAQLSKLVGREVINGQVDKTHIYNHEWDDPANFKHIGTIPTSKIEEITNGLLTQDVPVSLNKLIFDYDQIIICGPVFPHEVVGFSGGNKYFFPGIAGPDIINFTHWFGALLTNYEVIGSGYTPVRQIIDLAAEFVEIPSSCFSLVTTHQGISGIFFGSPQEAWQSASELSSRKHIIYLDQPFKQIISVMPPMYDDLWTAAKGMYKTEPVVADDGEVIIYAPQLTEVSYTHGKLINQIGYHCKEYFQKQWDKFKHIPGGILAHSTHLKGMGTYDATSGVEKPRVHVTLTTQISEEQCTRLNLGYRDPASINLEAMSGRESEGILVIPRAGEMLYRLK